MLDLLIKWSLKNRLVVLAIAGLVLFYGVLAVSRLSLDVFPALTRPTITVLTEVHGRAPEEVETLVTIPLEHSLTGVSGVERLRSTSGIGLSVVYLEFSWETDVYRARQLVAERLSLAKEQLPSDVQPVMAPISSIMGQIQQIALVSESEDISPMELRSFADWILRPRLLTIPGVSQVISIGGEVRQYQILISSEKLNHHQLSLEQLDEALSKISRNTSGGFFEKGDQEVLVRNIGAVRSIEEIQKTVVGLHFGRPVLVQDIAQVQIGPKIKRGDGSYMGKPSVVIVIQKSPEADTLSITRSVDKVIAEVQDSLPEEVKINSDIFKQSHFIESSIHGVISKLKWGSILVLAVLLLFLANLKMSLVTILAIPLSFFISFITFYWFGLSVNTMTLGGLAIAIGELVDDSIVDIENIYRRVKESWGRRPLLKIIYEASVEVRGSLVMATLIVALVFFPLFQLEGLEGRLFTPLAIAYLVALFSSLIVSLTLTPALSSYLFRNFSEKKAHGETVLVSKLKVLDKKILEKTLSRPFHLLGVFIILLLTSVVILLNKGSDFLPKFNEGTAMISIGLPPGTSLSRANEIGRQAEEKILQVPEVKFVSRRTGRADQDEHAMGVNISEIDVDFYQGTGLSKEEILNKVRAQLDELDSVAINVGQPISHLMDHALSGVSAQLAVKIFGEDLDLLRLKASELRDRFSEVEGLVDLRVEQQGLIPQLKVYSMRDEAAQFNLSSGDISSLLQSALNGEKVGSVIEGQRFFDLFYRFDESSRSSQEGIEKTVLKTMPNGKKVTVKDVADVYETQGPNEILRENGLRRIVVSANVSGRDLSSVVQEVKKLSDEIDLPPEYFMTFGGQFEAHEKAVRKIILYGLISLLGIAFVLFLHFKSQVLTAQVMMTIPFAFVGGVFALWFSGEPMTVASLVGFISLCGISCRNGIMMISHYLHLMKEEGESFGREMIVRGSLERLTPVLMTALVTMLALIPIAFSKGQPGSEILHPVAIVVIGGLVSSTLLDMILTPALFLRFGKKASDRYIEKSNKEEI